MHDTDMAEELLMMQEDNDRQTFVVFVGDDPESLDPVELCDSMDEALKKVPTWKYKYIEICHCVPDKPENDCVMWENDALKACRGR